MVDYRIIIIDFYNKIATVIKDKITIIGLGYVGLPLAVEFSKTNF